MSERAPRRRGATVSTAGHLYVAGLRYVRLLRRHRVAEVFQRASTDPALRVRVAQPDDPVALARLADRLFRRVLFPFPNRCLVKSLVLFAALHPTWPDLKLVIGLRRIPGSASTAMEGHAWLTLAGHVLSDCDRLAPEAFSATLVLGEHAS